MELLSNKNKVKTTSAGYTEAAIYTQAVIYTQAPKIGFGGAAKIAHKTFDFKSSRYCVARFVARGAFGVQSVEKYRTRIVVLFENILTFGANSRKTSVESSKS